MSLANNIEQKIDAYLKGKLSKDELVAFEALLAQDKELENTFSQEKMLFNAVFDHKLLNIKSIAEENEAALKRKSSKNKIKKHLLIGVGLVFIGIGTTYFFQKKETVFTPVLVDKQDNIKTPQEEQPKELTKEKTTPSPHVDNKKQQNAYPTFSDSSIKQTTLPINEDNTVVDTFKNEIPAPDTAKHTKLSIENICNKVIISPAIVAKGTCANKKEGSIKITEINGGTAPYTQELYNVNGTSFSSMKDLPNGQYELIITDAHSCFKVTSIVIPKLNCTIDDQFNPSLGEKWNIPVSNQKGTLNIHTRTGLSVYQKTINANESVYWDGQAANGVLPTGYYIFVINYTDGTVLKGSITITE